MENTCNAPLGQKIPEQVGYDGEKMRYRNKCGMIIKQKTHIFTYCLGILFNRKMPGRFLGIEV